MKKAVSHLLIQGVTKEVEDAIFSGKTFTAHEALQYGLVDNIGTFEETILERYPDHGIEEYSIGRDINLPNPNELTMSSAKWQSTIDTMQTLAELKETDITKTSVSEAVQEVLKSLSPEQFKALIEDVSDMSVEASFDNLKRSLV